MSATPASSKCNTHHLQSIRYVPNDHKETDPRISYLRVPRGIWAYRSGEFQLDILVPETNRTPEVLRPQSAPQRSAGLI